MKTEFIHNISHEIRTPLNAISGFSQIVTDRSVPIDDDKLADIRSQITQNTDRITRLVNKMLELSDANSRTIIERCDDVLAVQIAVSATEESRISQSDKFEFILDVSEEVSEVWLHTNQEYAEQALSQLLFNAEKFTNEGSVTLRVELAGDVVRFIVEDTGIGIAEADRSRIFDEFVQINTNYEGTGIGLPVARSIAQRLGGDVVLDNNYTNGSCFIMTLPT
jgi:signal transduction histidine kinase